MLLFDWNFTLYLPGNFSIEEQRECQLHQPAGNKKRISLDKQGNIFSTEEIYRCELDYINVI
jgi:hypothetical protein